MSDIIEKCRPWIEAALGYSGGTYLYEDVVAGIMSGRMQLWHGPKGCAVTEIVVYPRRKALHIFLAGGELEQFFDMYEDAAKWARAQGCTSMTLAGRPGWQRVMRAKGWKTEIVVSEKEL